MEYTLGQIIEYAAEEAEDMRVFCARIYQKALLKRKKIEINRAVSVMWCAFFLAYLSVQNVSQVPGRMFNRSPHFPLLAQQLRAQQ